MIATDIENIVFAEHHQASGAVAGGTVPNEDIARLLRYVIAMEGELCRIYKAADAHAEAASAMSGFVTTEVTLEQVAERMAGVEIARQQLCLMFPELPYMLREAYEDKLKELMAASEYPYAIDL